MATKNPRTGQHRDLFTRGDTAVWVPLGDLSREQIVALPMAAFSDDEWNELDHDTQWEILAGDDDVSERRSMFVALINPILSDALREDWTVQDAMQYEEGNLDSVLYDGQQLVSELKFRDQDAYEDILGGRDEDETEEALADILTDWDSWSWEVESYPTYGYGTSCVLSVPIEPSIYIEWGTEIVDMQPVELDYLLEEHEDMLEDRRVWDYITDHKDELLKSMQSGYHASYDHRLDPDHQLCGTPDVEYIKEQLAQVVGEEDEEDEDAEPIAVPDDQVIYRYSDGTFVKLLSAGELPEEGREMRMCVGKAGMGYIEAVEKREIAIFSIRTPSGRPKMTLEVLLSPGGSFMSVEQAKGKANRLPGFTRENVYQRSAKMKEVEVVRLLELLSFLGLSPHDVEDLGPAIVTIEREPDKYPDAAMWLEAASQPLKKMRLNPLTTFDEPYDRRRRMRALRAWKRRQR